MFISSSVVFLQHAAFMQHNQELKKNLFFSCNMFRDNIGVYVYVKY